MVVVKLKIGNKKELDKFYKLLPIYRSFLCKYIKFELINDKYNMDKIIMALNMKNRYKKISFIYDEACTFIDKKFVNIKNMCGFKNNRCYAQKGTNKCNGCCRYCKYQSNKGCTSSNLACKLFFCDEVRKRYEVIEFKDIDILKCFSLRQKILVRHSYFSSREDVIMDLYIGSLIIGVVRIYYRIIKGFVSLSLNNKIRYNKNS